MVRTVKSPDERRSEFITKAQELFFSKGYERTSINDIIDSVGVSKGAFYHYFDSKDAIMEAVVVALNAQYIAGIQAVVADDTLDAITKWKQLMRVGGHWKIDQKDDLRAISRTLRMDENWRLRDRLNTERAKLMSLECYPIIVQGIDEGVFNAEHPQEAMEYAFSIMTLASGACVDILLNPDVYKYPLTLARSKLKAAQSAIERILGAPVGSLPLADDPTLAAWFAD